MPNKPQLKQPLGIANERFDIKKGLSRKMASHQNEKSTWWNLLNFRFYKQNIFTVARKALYATVAPTAQSFTIPTPSCQVNTVPPTIVGDNAAYIGFGGSTGSYDEQHWIYDFTFTNGLQNLTMSDLVNNSTFVASAQAIDGQVRLTDAVSYNSGNVNINTPVLFLDSLGRLLNWSAYFKYAIGGSNTIERADGLSFILQSNSENAGAYGGGLGYGGINNSVAVGVDTFDNFAFGYADPNNNHVELDINGDVEHSLIVATNPSGTYPQNNLSAFATIVNSTLGSLDVCNASPIGSKDTFPSSPMYMWIDYANSIMSIYLSNTSTKPSGPIIEYPIDITEYLTLS